MISSQDPVAVRRTPAVDEARSDPDRLRPAIYSELRDLAERLFRRERNHHTLEPTALVHEAWLKLAAQERMDWSGRRQVLAIGAQAMRRILVDHARARQREKRGGDRSPVALSEDLFSEKATSTGLVDLDGALARLERLDPRQAKVVELRFFAGLGVRGRAGARALGAHDRGGVDGREGVVEARAGRGRSRLIPRAVG